ncbi:YcaO-like family protein [Salinibacterium sp. NG22]|uniref:YcaO-like family protein n=1 Tax=Salinibacterium sp. NG22 TaxID=2792040 RepID=UPI0018CFA118|nr:YcaO-like family protein [Salinibacterium sp. NG22]MBH0110049.1 YcaO-like family protein [Salinibacterium sp. NG22]
MAGTTRDTADESGAAAVADTTSAETAAVAVAATVATAERELEQRIALSTLTTDSCLAVGSDGQLWHLTVAASTVTADVRELLRAAVQPTHLPRASPLDVRFDSVQEMLGLARLLDKSAGGCSCDCGSDDSDTDSNTGSDSDEPAMSLGALFPFAGHWHRLLLEAGSAVATAQFAVDCLAATIADPATAAALMVPADTASPATRSAALDLNDDSIPAPLAGILERWTDSRWVSHALTPSPLVDPVTGILHRVRRRPALAPLPAGFVHLHAELPHLQSVKATFTPDALAPAGALDDGRRSEAELLEPALLSGVAHYCGADLEQGIRTRASLAELQHSGERAFELASWPPHDPTLHALPGFPFVELRSDTRIDWVRGQDAAGDIWVPQSLVFADYLRGSRNSALATNTNNLVGQQAGRTQADAVERAAAHAVAHDAVAVWWSSTAAASAVPLPQSVATVFAESELKVRILAIPSTTGIPVRLAVVDDVNNTILSLGFAAHTDDDTASELAIVEALIQHASAQDLAQENSLIRDSAALGNGAIAGLVSWDPQRRYAHAFGSEHRGLIDPMAHVQYGLDPTVVEHARQRTQPRLQTQQGLSSTTGSAAPDASSSAAPPAAPTSVTAAVSATLITVDVTTERVRAAGFHAVRAIIPGFARLQPAAFPLDPLGRLTEARESLGWDAALAPGPYPGW